MNQGNTEIINPVKTKLTKSTVMVMAVGAGMTVANIYYNQPLLADISRTFGATPKQSGVISLFTQMGYALGMLFLVPLGDMFPRKKLILIMTLLVSVFLIGAAVSSTLPFMIVASLLIGLTNVTPQLLVPLAANLALPEERGKIVGTVMSGLLIGILLSRTVSGFVGAHFGWRSMYWSASALMLILCITLGILLPEDKSNFKGNYKSLMFSLISLTKEQYYLKTSSIIGGVLFGSFTAFWTTLIFLLEGSPFHYNSQAAGMFGIVGAAGALAAPLVGKIADKKSPLFTIGLGLKASVLSYIIFLFSSHSLIGLIIGVLILDIGVQATHISNQSLIYSLVPEARSRLNTVYMFTYFVGGATGSALGAYAWTSYGWNGVSTVGLILTTSALLIHTIFNKDKSGVLLKE